MKARAPRRQTPRRGKPDTVNQYLAQLTAEQRAALEKLRKEIRAAAPEARECIAYGIPAYRVEGKMLVAFGAATHHCAFYPGAHPMKAHAAELHGYDTAKGTIRFPPNRPLPASLVRKLVKTRVAERGGPTGSRRRGSTHTRR